MIEMTNEQKIMLDAEINELQAKLLSAERSHQSMREENSSLERQAELLTMEISTVCFLDFIICSTLVFIHFLF